MFDLTYKQGLLIACPANEILFGGARGGGKTSGIILDFLDNYERLGGNCRGLFLRRTFKELEGTYDTLNFFLKPVGFELNLGRQAYFHPSGASLKLGYMMREEDADSYQGHQYSWIGIDEVGNFLSFKGIDRLILTLRGFSLPPRIVMTANPGGKAHDIIKQRFDVLNPFKISFNHDGWSRVYIPSLFEENSYLVEKDPLYLKRATENLPDYLKRAWMLGDWNIAFRHGMFFRQSDFENQIIDSSKIPRLTSVCRAWDRAATVPSETNPDPDWTVGAKIAKDGFGNFYVLDVIRRRERSASIRSLILNTAKADGNQCSIVLFQDPGQSGKGEAEDMSRLLAGYNVRIYRETGAKHLRWLSFSAAVQNGIVFFLKSNWNDALIDELCSLTDNQSDYAHDDQADACSLAFNFLSNKSSFVVESLGKIH